MARLSQITIKTKAIGITTAAAFTLAVAAILVAFGLETHRNHLSTVERTSHMVIDQVIPLGERIAEIRYDVVQVQQFLTDISATRGLNGLDDGERNAADYAARFEAVSAEASTIAGRLGLDAIRQTLDATRKKLRAVL